MNTKRKSAAPPLAKGQLWRTEKAYVQIVGMGKRLIHYKMPREVYFVQSLPRTASGKILRRELRKLV